jgi:predicted acylesterase/phospholipase RssA
MKYDMVFEGGGAKGMVFVGAMQEFEARGHSHDRLLGTSAGAITAALLAAGYTAAEMMEALAENIGGRSVFSDFMGDPGPFSNSPLVKDGALAKLLVEIDIPLIPGAIEKRLDQAIINWMATSSKGTHLFSFVELGGWYSADNFLKWISRKLDSGEHNGKPRQFSKVSLEQFYKATGKDLTLIASDTAMERMLVLNHRTAPDLPLVWAVRMSMSIPLLWQEVVWKKEWGKYRDEEMEGHSIVDGGLLSNFPIELFISDLKNVTEVMGPKTSLQPLGMLIDESQPVPGVPLTRSPEEKQKFELGQLATVQRLNKLVNTTLGARDKAVIEAFEDMVVRLPAQGYGTTEFDMTDERREKLVEGGRLAMQAYFTRHGAAGIASFGVETASLHTPLNTADKVATRMLR